MLILNPLYLRHILSNWSSQTLMIDSVSRCSELFSIAKKGTKHLAFHKGDNVFILWKNIQCFAFYSNLHLKISSKFSAIVSHNRLRCQRSEKGHSSHSIGRRSCHICVLSWGELQKERWSLQSLSRPPFQINPIYFWDLLSLSTGRHTEDALWLRTPKLPLPPCLPTQEYRHISI